MALALLGDLPGVVRLAARPLDIADLTQIMSFTLMALLIIWITQSLRETSLDGSSNLPRR